MARDGFDCSELMEFAEQLGAQPKELEKVQKKLLRDEGSKLRRKTAQQARATVNRTAVHRKEYDRAAGQYHKSIKRGKLYYRDKAVCIRVYSSDPVAHLHEYGWRVKKRDKRTGKLMEGKKVFDAARDEYAPTFAEAVEELVDEVIRKI